jgi:hypothetical protein
VVAAIDKIIIKYRENSVKVQYKGLNESSGRLVEYLSERT